MLPRNYLRLLIICIQCLLVRSEDAVPMDRTFAHMLARDSYFNASGPVRFLASALNYPDLPDWLRLSQGKQTEDAVIYGTPTSKMDGAEVEVVAVNLETYKHAYKRFNIEVGPSIVGVQYLVELWITNLNVAEFFAASKSMVGTLGNVWPQAKNDLHPVKVMSLVEVTGDYSLPVDPAGEIKEGVLVQFGSSAEFSNELKTIEQQRGDDCKNLQKDSKIAQLDANLTPFVIDWCQYRLISPDMQVMQSTPPPPEPFFSEDSNHWEPRSYEVEPRDLRTDFIITVVFPLALGLLLFLILSYVMFGRREGVAKRDQKTPESQLMQFDSIRRATTNLRYMSQRRDGPPSVQPRDTSTPMGTPAVGERRNPVKPEGSLPGALPRTQPPPPYRLPPGYNPEGDTMWSRRSQLSERESSFGGQGEEERSGEEQKLVGDSSRETLPVRGQ